MKKNLKTLGLLLAWMGLGGMIGYLAARGSQNLDLIGSIQALAQAWMDQGYRFFMAWVLASSLGLSLLTYGAKRQVQASHLRGDELEKDGLLGLALVLTSLALFLTIGFFLVSLFGLEGRWALFPRAFLACAGSLIILALLQHWQVEIVKNYHPEKQGQVTDLNFHKKWLNSSDEREQVEIYQAGYRAFQNLQAALPILLVLFGLYSWHSQQGLQSIVLLLLINLILQLSYYYQAYRTERAQKKRAQAAQNEKN